MVVGEAAGEPESAKWNGAACGVAGAPATNRLPPADRPNRHDATTSGTRRKCTPTETVCEEVRRNPSTLLSEAPLPSETWAHPLSGSGASLRWSVSRVTSILERSTMSPKLVGGPRMTIGDAIHADLVQHLQLASCQRSLTPGTGMSRSRPTKATEFRTRAEAELVVSRSRLMDP
jgi:hypothetical protein